MTEEQFWRSNPRIINVYNNIYKDNQKSQNILAHAWVGTYVQSALFAAIDGCLNGRKAKSKYIEKPIELFEPTEEEKAIAQQRELQRFIAWGDAVIARFNK